MLLHQDSTTISAMSSSAKSITTSSSPETPSTFYLLRKLPAELQDIVWTELLPPPRVVELAISSNKKHSDNLKAIRLAYGMKDLKSYCCTLDAHVPNQSFYDNLQERRLELRPEKIFPRTGLHPDSNLTNLLSTCHASRSVVLQHYRLYTNFVQLRRPFYFSPARDVLLISVYLVLSFFLWHDRTTDLSELPIRNLAIVYEPTDTFPSSNKPPGYNSSTSNIIKRFGTIESLLLYTMEANEYFRMSKADRVLYMKSRERSASAEIASLANDQNQITAARRFQIPKIIHRAWTQTKVVKECIPYWDDNHFRGHLRSFSRAMAENFRFWLDENGFRGEEMESSSRGEESKNMGSPPLATQDWYYDQWPSFNVGNKMLAMLRFLSRSSLEVDLQTEFNGS